MHMTSAPCHIEALQASALLQPAATASGHEAKILSGIRVVDLSTVIAAPTCCAYLADMGADVIKLERPGDMDVSRTWGHKDDPAYTASPAIFDRGHGGSSFTQFNRGKRSLVLDIQKPEGQQVLFRLLEKADVFVTNVRNRSMKRLGLDYESLRSKYPRLIYAHLSAWGQTGPMLETPGFDVGAWWAHSGIMELARSSDDAPMPRQVGGIGDSVLATQLAGFIGLALYHRERTGVGQYVDAALLRSGIAAIAHPMAASAGRNAFITGPISKAGGMGMIRETTQLGERRTSMNYVPFRMKCGTWVHMMDLVIDRFLPKLFRMLGVREEDILGPLDQRDPEGVYLKEATTKIDNILATKTWAEWRPLFLEHDVWHAVCNKFEDVWDDEQAKANGAFVHHPDIRHPVVGVPILMSAHQAEPRGRAPGFGEHTSEVLREVGFSTTDEAALREKGIVE